MVKETLTAKVSPKTLNRLEKHADNEGISKSEAADRLLKQGLDVEESDMRLVPVKADGGTIIEDRLDRIEQSQQDRLNQIEEIAYIDQTEQYLRVGVMSFATWTILFGIANILLNYQYIAFLYISFILTIIGIIVHLVYVGWSR
jgi:hypothetical protein